MYTDVKKYFTISLKSETVQKVQVQQGGKKSIIWPNVWTEAT
jgi:hypothetical protein